MTERLLDVSEGPARLSVRHDQVVVEKKDGASTVPLSEIAVLLVSHPAVTYTNAVLSGICSNGGLFVLCNERRLPAGMLLPLDGNYIQAERFLAQAQAPLPLKKQLWKQIVRTKVIAQGNLLQQTTGKDHGLFILAGRVRSGDASNIEAQASKKYWGVVFGEDFRRNHEGGGLNILLNYGYGVLRAASARAICSAGLHPSLGIHHHNRYNPFCLADDLMEPYRPAVDALVCEMTNEKGFEISLGRESKAFIVKRLLERRFNISGEERGLFDSLARSASSLSAAFSGKRKTILLPE